MHLQTIDSFRSRDIREKREYDDCNGIPDRDIFVVFSCMNANRVPLRHSLSNAMNFERCMVCTVSNSNLVEMTEHPSNEMRSRCTQVSFGNC